jgi:methyl-accepting chemotaxis protein
MADQTQVELTERMNELLREQLRIKRALNDFGSSSVRDMADAADSATRSTTNMTDAARTAAESTEEFGDAAEDTTKKSSSFSDFFKRVKERSKEFIASVANMIEAVFNFGKSFFSLMTGSFILDGLIQKANNLPINTAFAEAKEEVREFAGDLKSGMGQSIMKSFYNFSEGAKGFGVSLRKVYGFGASGMAARLKDVKDLFEKLGSSASNLSQKLQETAGEIIFTGKALGIGNEGVAEMLKTAEALGIDGTKYVRQFQLEAAKSLGTYGISAKVMGRGMSELLKTLPHLAKEGAKAFAPIVAYAQKMGLELKQVTGILDTFSSADKALEAASNLAQIGIALDPLELVAEQDPAKMLMKIGDAFKYSGKQIDLNDRHQRAYLKSTLQIDDATLNRLASENGLADSYKKTAANAEVARKRQMSQQEIMEELGKGIKRLIQAMNPKNFTGFFDALIQGFSDGAMNLGPMLKTLYTIKGALQQAYYAGRELGVMFMTYFPGVQQMLGGIAKLFDRAAGGKFLGVIRDAMKGLLAALNQMENANPKEAIDKFFNRLKAGYLEYSKSTGNFWLNIMPGLKNFSAAVGPIIAGVIRFIGRELVNGIKGLASIIKDGFTSGGESGGGLLGDAGTVIKNLVMPVWDALAESGPQLWGALKDLFWTTWDNIKPTLMEWKDRFLDWMSETFDSLSQTIRNGWNGAPSAASRLWDSTKEALSAVWNFLGDWFKDTAWPAVSGWWDELVDKWKPRILMKLGELTDTLMVWLSSFQGALGAPMRALAAEMAGLNQVDVALAAGGNADALAQIKNRKSINDAARAQEMAFLKEKEDATEAAKKAQEERERQDRQAQREYERKAAEAARATASIQQDLAAGFTPAMTQQMSTAVAEQGTAMKKLAEDVTVANGQLSEATAASTGFSNLQKSWKNGKLEVSHNLPQTQVKFSVTLDSKMLLGNLYKVNVGTSDSPVYMSANPSETRVPDRSG